MQAGVSLLILDVMPIHDHCLGYHHNYLRFYQLPNSNLFIHHMLFSREKPLVKSTAPGSILYHICFPIYYLPLRSIFIRFYFQIYYSKNPKIPCCTFLLLILFRVYSRSILSNLHIFYPVNLRISYAITRKRD